MKLYYPVDIDLGIVECSGCEHVFDLNIYDQCPRCNPQKKNDKQAFRQKVMTRQEAMNNPTVHYLTKDILKLTEGKDCVDVYHDIKLALRVVEEEMNQDLQCNPQTVDLSNNQDIMDILQPE